MTGGTFTPLSASFSSRPATGGETHHVEVVAGHEADGHPHRVLLPLQRVDHPRVFGDPGEALGALAEVGDLGNGEVDVVAAGSLDRVTDVDEAIAVLVGKGPQQHAAHDAEDGGVRANPESEGEDDGDREAASAGKTAYGVAEVGDEHGRVRQWFWSTCLPLLLVNV